MIGDSGISLVKEQTRAVLVLRYALTKLETQRSVFDHRTTLIHWTVCKPLNETIIFLSQNYPETKKQQQQQVQYHYKNTKKRANRRRRKKKEEGKKEGEEEEERGGEERGGGGGRTKRRRRSRRRRRARIRRKTLNRSVVCFCFFRFGKFVLVLMNMFI